MNSSDSISTHYRTCNLCEAMCGIEIRHQGDQIMSIRGDKADPFSRGSICPKATALQDIHNDPDRLRYPVRRTLDGWKEMSWDEALELVADKIKATQEKQGKDAVGLYLGNPTVHNHGAMLMLPLLLASLQTKNQFSATSADQLPHMLASYEMFGNQYLMPIPDLDHTQTFVCIGGNPLVSNGSIMTVPDVTARLKDIQKKGGKIIVVDPRRTETAELADQHIAINPASDPFLLLGILNVIFKEGRETLGTTEGFVDGLDIVKEMALRFTPEKVSGAIGITSDIITNLAREICESDSAIIYGRFGVCTQEYGGLNAWLLYVLNIVTGNLDTRGGVMFTRPAIDVAGLTDLAGEGGSFNTRQSRVRKLPEFGGQLPVVTMAEEILTPGKDQIKTLITHAGNPVLSTPDGKQLEKALESLDFMVSIDFYINETTQYANIILPPTGPLEHDHYDLAFHIFAIRNTTKYSSQLFQADKATRHDWEILLGLSTRIDAKNWHSRLASTARHQVLQRIGSEGLLDLALRFGPYGQTLPVVDKLDEFCQDMLIVGKPYSKLRNTAIKTLRDIKLIDQLIRVSPYGIDFNPIRSGLSLSKLKESPHGIDIGPLEPCLPDRLANRDKRIKLAPETFIKDMQRLNAKLLSNNTFNNSANSKSTDNSNDKDLLLIGRRQIRSNNSWLHNSLRLVKGKPRCTVMIHPIDAKTRKVEAGDIVTVESRIGKIQVAAEITDEIKQGVISIPHGWGHHRAGTRMPIAERHAGVSINDITDTQFIDSLTGTTAFSGVPVSLVGIKAQTPSRKKAVTKKPKVKKVSAKKAAVKKPATSNAETKTKATKKTTQKMKSVKKPALKKKAVSNTKEDGKSNSSDKEGRPENTDKPS